MKTATSLPRCDRRSQDGRSTRPPISWAVVRQPVTVLVRGNAGISLQAVAVLLQPGEQLCPVLTGAGRDRQRGLRHRRSRPMTECRSRAGGPTGCCRKAGSRSRLARRARCVLGLCRGLAGVRVVMQDLRWPGARRDAMGPVFGSEPAQHAGAAFRCLEHQQHDHA